MTRIKGLRPQWPNKMSEIDSAAIMAVIFGDEDPSIRHQFVNVYQEEVDKFVNLMAQAFTSWSELDKVLTQDKKERKAYISALLYAALHSHVVSLKLLISGLLVPSGNTQRYVLECVAMAFLLSRPSLGVVEKYMSDKYSTNNAVRDVVRNRKKLRLDREALNVLERSVKFYDKFSHPTRLSLGAVMTLNGSESKTILGGAYDPGKDFAYQKELASKVGLAEIFPNIIYGVELNFNIEA